MNILPDRLSDLSTAAESGHREIDQVRVNEFVDLFRSGRYGRGLLRGPGVIRGMTDGSGKMLLEDGQAYSVSVASWLPLDMDSAAFAHKLVS